MREMRLRRITAGRPCLSCGGKDAIEVGKRVCVFCMERKYMERMIARAEADATNSCLKCGKERYAFSNRCRCCTLLGYLVKNILTYKEDLNYHTQIYIFWSVEYFWHVYPLLCEAFRKNGQLQYFMNDPITAEERAQISAVLLKHGHPEFGPTPRPPNAVAIVLEESHLTSYKKAFDALAAVRATVEPSPNAVRLSDDDRSWF